MVWRLNMIDSSIPLKAGDTPLPYTREQVNSNIRTDIAAKNAPIERASIQSQTDTRKYALAASKFSAVQGILANVKDQQSLDAARDTATQWGLITPDEAKKYSVYNPDQINALVDTVAQHKLLLEQEKTRADIGKTQAETTKLNNEANLINTFSGGSANMGNGLTGDDYLKTLPPSAAAQIKGMAEGNLPLPNGRVLTTPYGQAIMNAVMQYDPAANAINLPARQKTRQDFTSGKSSENIAALNTAMSHLDRLNENFGKLHNSDYPLWNAVANPLSIAFGNKDIQNATSKVGADAGAVSHELAKVFRSTGMSEGEIKEWEKKISSNNSPEQNKAVVEEAIDLMNGRLDSIGEKYNQGMGTTKDPLELLSPGAKAIYERITGKNSGEKVQKAIEPMSMQAPAIQQNRALSNRVQLAKQHGYTDAEIQAFLGGR